MHPAIAQMPVRLPLTSNPNPNQAASLTLTLPLPLTLTLPNPNPNPNRNPRTGSSMRGGYVTGSAASAARRLRRPQAGARRPNPSRNSQPYP